MAEQQAANRRAGAGRCADGAKHTVALCVEYDGGAFHGFQRQTGLRTVQSALEDAAGQVADEPVTLVAAGRTDAGVHATSQVVSFHTETDRPDRAWRAGISSLTPSALGVVCARVFPDAFHARFDALWRRYIYIFSDAPTRPVLHRGLVAWAGRHQAPLNHEAMHTAAQSLIGEHDFSSFRAAGCQSRSPWRRVHAIRVRRVGSHVAIDITANAFLLRMVRNIAGALLAVGRGELSTDALAELLRLHHRPAAPPTAPPQGLYLVGVGYRNRQFPSRPPPILAGATALDSQDHQQGTNHGAQARAGEADSGAGRSVGLRVRRAGHLAGHRRAQPLAPLRGFLAVEGAGRRLDCEQIDDAIRNRMRRRYGSS